jgi:hypothetical protein
MTRDASTSARARGALTAALKTVLGDVEGARFVAGTHTKIFDDNLLGSLSEAQRGKLRAELEGGAGGELQATSTGKRPAHAPYSSATLAINAFGPWLGREGELRIAGLAGFEGPLAIESKQQIAHGGGVANLDVLLRGPDLVVGVESKLTETLAPHHPVSWRDPYWSAEMATLLDDRWRAAFEDSLHGRWQPSHLGVEQLIKHALAIRSRFPDPTRRHLVYVFWEPEDGDAFGEVRAHREEVAQLAARLVGADPCFHPLTYAALLEEWEGIADPRHLEELRARYAVSIG